MGILCLNQMQTCQLIRKAQIDLKVQFAGFKFNNLHSSSRNGYDVPNVQFPLISV